MHHAGQRGGLWRAHPSHSHPTHLRLRETMCCMFRVLSSTSCASVAVSATEGPGDTTRESTPSGDGTGSVCRAIELVSVWESGNGAAERQPSPGEARPREEQSNVTLGTIRVGLCIDAVRCRCIVCSIAMWGARVLRAVGLRCPPVQVGVALEPLSACSIAMWCAGAQVSVPYTPRGPTARAVLPSVRRPEGSTLCAQRGTRP